MTSAIVVERVVPLVLFASFIAGITLVAKISPVTLLRNLKPFLFLFIFTIVLHSVMTPGRTLFSVPLVQLAVSEKGLLFGLIFSARLALMVSVAGLMTLTTTPLSLTDGLERLLCPLKRLGFPAHEFAMMISIALRFIPVLAEEAERIQRAQLARGADFSGSLLRRARQMVPLLVPLFVAAFDRADRLAIAMESRCYQGGEGRTSYRELAFGTADLTAAALVVTAAVLMIGQSLLAVP